MISGRPARRGGKDQLEVGGVCGWHEQELKLGRRSRGGPAASGPPGSGPVPHVNLSFVPQSMGVCRLLLDATDTSYHLATK